MLRVSSNCSVMLTCPSVLCEVISVTDAMRPNSRSSGVATDEAMISGLAPGNMADTATVGKSTCGSGDTGSTRNAEAPANTSAAASRVVAIGRLMKGAEKFMAVPDRYACGSADCGGVDGGIGGASAGGCPRL